MPGIYVHIPFCRAKCPYCDFLSYPIHSYVKNGGVSAVLDAMEHEIELWSRHSDSRGLVYDTLFIGGGTPSLIAADSIIKIVNRLKSCFLWKEDTEFTVEVNPESLNKDWLYKLLDVGLTRLSIGVQDLTQKGLKALGRLHGADEALQAIELAQNTESLEVSVDLIYNWPGQSAIDLDHTLSVLSSCLPEHISAYELNIEPRTPFYRAYCRNELSLPEDEVADNIYLSLMDWMSKHNYVRYEISNFCRDGHICRHNMNYWKNGTYLGIGPAAASFLPPKRGVNPGGIRSYTDSVKNGVPVWSDVEILDSEARFRESVMLALRTVQGIDLKEMESMWGYDTLAYYGHRIDRLTGDGLLRIEGGRMFLTHRGIRFSNIVFRELI